jgi:hypothetical protein
LGEDASSQHNLRRPFKMSLITWFFGGLFGLAGVSSFAEFLLHMLSGNPDTALMYFVGMGGSVAVGWMLASCHQA